MDKIKEKLFDQYNQNPYELDDNPIDKFVDSQHYQTLFNIFEPLLLRINKYLELKYFKENFNYSSENLILLSPQRLPFNFLIKAECLDKILQLHPNTLFQVECSEWDIKEENIEEQKVNHYAILANKINSHFEIVSSSKNAHTPCKPKTTSSSTLLNLMNFSLKQLISELLSKMKFKNKATYIEVGENYIKREIKSELFYKGYSPFKIDKILEKVHKSTSVKEHQFQFDEMDKALIKKELLFFLKTQFSFKEVQDAYLELLEVLFTKRIRYLKTYKNSLRQEITNVTDKIEIDFALISALNYNKALALYDAFSYNNIPVFSTEHGLTTGISKDSTKNYYTNETNYSDFLLVYNDASLKTFSRNKNSRAKLHAVGAHSFSKKLRFKKLKKLYYKRKFNISDKEIILYVSHSLERNLGKYFPWTKTNSEIFRDELSILETLSKQHRKVIYKPHFLTDLPFNKKLFIQKHIKHLSNIELLSSDEDFRYIRCIADIIVTNSSESTLEWCIGSKVPLFFLDSKFYEPLENDDVIEVFKNSFFFYNYDKADWSKFFIESLNRPLIEISKEWELKKPFRVRYDNKYFLSEKKNAGKEGTKFIINQLNIDK